MNVNKRVIHHSASGRDSTSVADIARWHRERGFSQIGYHKVILGDGSPVPASLRENVQDLANNLQVIRDNIGKSIHINSGYRTPSYNSSTGGSTNSQHLVAKAADIRVNGLSSSDLHSVILNLINSGTIKQGGVGLYRTFVHYDVRGQQARWSKI
mgnify:CR=1 FL=1